MKRIMMLLLTIVVVFSMNATVFATDGTEETPEKVNHALNATYEMLRDGVEALPHNTYLSYDVGINDWEDVDCTRLNDGIVATGAELNTNGALPGTSVQLLGTGVMYSIIFTLDGKQSIDKVVLRDVRDGDKNDNNRGFSEDIFPMVYVSDDGNSWKYCTGVCDEGVPVEGAPEICNQFNPDIRVVENVDYTFTLDEMASGKYVKVDISSNCYIMQLDEIELWGDKGIKYGDVNNDGKVSPLDASLVLQYNAKLITELAEVNAADVNGDGKISPLDASLILQYNAKLIDELPYNAAE